LLSDVHLGSDLVHHAQPSAPRRARWSERRNRELSALLDWYRDHPQSGRSWRLVIAGDFVDFAGMSVPFELATDTAPTDEERVNGLGNGRDHTLAKLRLVMAHDAIVMESLARFLARGNSLVIVRGNHDVEWHWEEVQDEFRRELTRYAELSPEQVEFAPWFYYEEGVVFVEHGHQYDAYCSYEHVLHPVLPSDPRRTVRSLSEILLRYVVRPTRGMSEAGHAGAGVLDYLGFAFRLGTSGMLGLARRFAYATQALFSLWREHLSDAAHRVRREHDLKIESLSRVHRIKLERLIELARLWRPPITRSFFAILTAVMLDRVLLALIGLALVLTCVLWIESRMMAAGAALGSVLALVALGVLWRTLRHSIEPSAELRETSKVVARLFPAAFVVMGHTHMPEMRSMAEQTTYINLGAWAEEDASDGRAPALPATRTHLVLARVDEGPIAELLTWENDGPVPFGRTGEKSRILELFDRG
jgi:UDP-2,3-diacylglucosamine pyrophosphatase LpxH